MDDPAFAARGSTPSHDVRGQPRIRSHNDNDEET
jgi:hypothetical protein